MIDCSSLAVVPLVENAMNKDHEPSIFNVYVYEGKTIKFWGLLNCELHCTEWVISQGVQIFDNGDEMLFAFFVLDCVIHIFIVKNVFAVFRWGQTLGTNLGFLESLKLILCAFWVYNATVQNFV